MQETNAMGPSDAFLQRIMEHWPPPSQRRYTGAQIGFGEIERELGLALPLSYKELTYTYGQGIWFETIVILNPFFAWLNDLEPWMSPRGYPGGPSWCSRLRTSREQYPAQIVSPIYPEPAGIFPWAFLQDGGVLYWVTVGLPEKWKILHDRDMVFEESWESFTMSVTELLWRLASGDPAVSDSELDQRIAPYRAEVFRVC
jgi:hypothetical protein